MTGPTSLSDIKAAIAAAAKQSACSVDAVTLLAVSKGQSIEKIQALVAQGQRCFGESYCQEALDKIQTLSELALEWHFIGAIQSNKTQVIAENFSWVHSVSRLKIADRLNAQRPANLPPLNICIAVNISEEATKSGVAPAAVSAMAAAIEPLKHLRLRGLMAIPAPGQPQQLTQLAQLQQQLKQQGINLDTLSMGMSHDFPAAIAAGSTIVRIGTALFGPRQ